MVPTQGWTTFPALPGGFFTTETPGNPLCAPRVLLMWNLNGAVRDGGLIYYIPHLSCPCSIAPCDFAYKHKFKDKIIKNFKMVMAECWIKSGSLLNQGSLGQYRSCAHQATKCSSLKILCEMLWSVKWDNFFQTFWELLLCLYPSEHPQVIEDLALTVFSSEKMGRTSGNIASDLFLCWICCLSNKDSRDEHRLLHTNHISPKFIDV